MSSFRNTVVVALMQIGVIVAGVLAAGLCRKAWLSSGLAMPAPAAMLYNYGVIAFAIPVIWAVLTLSWMRRPEITDEIKGLAFWSGVLVLVLLIGFVWHADVSPWFHFDYATGGVNDA